MLCVNWARRLPLVGLLPATSMYREAPADADLSIPLNGKLRHGTVYVVAKKTDGVWSYDKLEMLVEGRDIRIELLPHPPPQPEDK